MERIVRQDLKCNWLTICCVLHAHAHTNKQELTYFECHGFSWGVDGGEDFTKSPLPYLHTLLHALWADTFLPRQRSLLVTLSIHLLCVWQISILTLNLKKNMGETTWDKSRHVAVLGHLRHGFMVVVLLRTLKLQLSSCDCRHLGSDDRNGVAKRSWLTSTNSAFLGVPTELELFGVCSTTENKGYDGLKIINKLNYLWKMYLRTNEHCYVTHALAVDGQGSFESAPGVCVWC